MSSSSLEQQLQVAVAARRPLVYILSGEQQRVTAAVTRIAAANASAVISWSCLSGFSTGPGGDDYRDPAAALAHILASDQPTFFILHDLHAYLDRPEVVRALREFYVAAQHQQRMLFLLAPLLVLPDVLKKEVHLIEAPLPDPDELHDAVGRLRQLYPNVDIADQLIAEVIPALRGLTIAEAGHIMHRVLAAGKIEPNAILDAVFAEKQMIIRRSGLLDFFPPRNDLAGLGGLGVLKQWLLKRKSAFSAQAATDGVPMPKGVLIMGVSGCGKSLAIKTISALWNVPLFRLDMNRVFSGLYGSAEAAFAQALQTIESVAPAVLWIDEIENSLGLDNDKISIASHIFSTFLTWMQEKPPLVFIGATANRIHALPAEIIRKGRFDEVFFVDLPNEKERREILRIHLSRSAADLAAFDLDMLAIMMDGWNGAEIEQAVVSARIEAYYDQRPFGMDDVAASVGKIVPLSTTMQEQIKSIRGWALARATPASSFSRLVRH